MLRPAAKRGGISKNIETFDVGAEIRTGCLAPTIMHIRLCICDAIRLASKGEQKANTMHAQAAHLKREIEAKLASRIPAALSPIAQQAPRLHPMGSVRIDNLLGGGLPLGSVCELTGLDGSGRTSLALSLLSQASRTSACAYIDVSCNLSPHSAAAAGVRLGNLLWVRFAAAAQIVEAASRLPVIPPLEVGTSQRRLHDGCGSSHPRGETKGLAPALEEMLFYKEERRRRKMQGTPGHPNQPLGLHTPSQDQVDWERWNLRRVDESDPLRQRDKEAAEAARLRARTFAAANADGPREKKPFDRLARALRATDQVLQSGGFRVVVLDMAFLDAKDALRIPSATWFRFRRAAQESDAILLLLTQTPCARSSAACVLECSASEPPKIQGVLSTAQRVTEVARQRTGPAQGRKAPGRVTSWSAEPAWMQAAGK